MKNHDAAFKAPTPAGSGKQASKGSPVTVYAKPGQVARITIDIVIGDADEVLTGRRDRRAPTFKLVPVEPPRGGGEWALYDSASSSSMVPWQTSSPGTVTPEGDPDSATPGGTPDSATPAGSSDSATPEGSSDFAFPIEP